MGKRSATKTVTAVLVAFQKRRSWSQADLARAVGVRTEALREVLKELVEAGLRLESEKSHPHIYWRVPKSWYPGAVVFKEDDVPELVRQLGRLPKSKARDRLLSTVIEQLPARGKLTPIAPIVSRQASEHEELYVPVVEDAAARKVPLFMRYFTSSRGVTTERRASAHLVDVGPPARFIATCHRNGDLRWFRVDGILYARPDGAEPFRGASEAEIVAFRRASLDGYKGDSEPVECSFLVRRPESSWVANNLLEGMRVENFHDGIRVLLDTSAVLRLARFVVGLGEAAHPESQELASAVAELARGALAQASQKPASSEEEARDAARPSSDV